MSDSAWPSFKMARELAGSVFPVSETVILQTARKNGIGRKMGRAILFSPDDCNQLYEVLPCHSSSLSDQNRRTGSSGAPSGESALRKALALATERQPKKSARSARQKSSHSRSTVVELPQRSQRQP
jgi:hypothetical protein